MTNNTISWRDSVDTKGKMPTKPRNIDMSLKDWILSDSASTLPWIRLMDGGVSTHLEQLLQSQDPLAIFSHRSLWSSSLLLTTVGQDTIFQGHKDWLAAGSDILTTVTYQCHYGVPGHELDVSQKQMTAMMQNGVQIAKRAMQKTINDTTKQSFVVASSGCYGAALADGSEYTGIYPNMDFDGLVGFHEEKAITLLSENPDGLAIETIPCVMECTAICKMLASLHSQATVTPCCWISLACKDGKTLNEGKPLVEALQTIRNQDPQAKYVHAIGINCCDSAHISSLLEILTQDMARHGPRRGIVVYPNSGEEWDASSESWREGTDGCQDPDSFSDHLIEGIDVVERTWKKYEGSLAMPKVIVGGCCRTSPASIEALRRGIDSWHEENASKKS